MSLSPEVFGFTVPILALQIFFYERNMSLFLCKPLHLWCNLLHDNVKAAKKEWLEVQHLHWSSYSDFAAWVFQEAPLNHETLFSLMFFSNFHLLLTAWRTQVIWNIESITMVFVFPFSEMPRGEILSTLTHCALISHLTANTL